jgi:hypothetical protein
VSALDLVLLAAAALGAGAVNAVAGGGSLISFPALLAAGYPPVTANVTNAVAVVPGYLGGSVAYRDELRGQGGRARALGVTAAIGSLAGAALLLALPASVFEVAAPVLILVSCALLALQPRLSRALGPQRRAALHEGRIATHSAIFAAAVYGGYFGAGLGVLLLAVLAFLVDDDLQRLNALKGVLSLVVGVAGALFFALFGPVAWPAAAVMAVGSYVGGHSGVSVARRLPAAALRGGVVVLGTAVAVVLIVA